MPGAARRPEAIPSPGAILTVGIRACDRTCELRRCALDRFVGERRAVRRTRQARQRSPQRSDDPESSDSPRVGRHASPFRDSDFGRGLERLPQSRGSRRNRAREHRVRLFVAEHERHAAADPGARLYASAPQICTLQRISWCVAWSCTCRDSRRRTFDPALSAPTRVNCESTRGSAREKRDQQQMPLGQGTRQRRQPSSDAHERRSHSPSGYSRYREPSANSGLLFRRRCSLSPCTSMPRRRPKACSSSTATSARRPRPSSSRTRCAKSCPMRCKRPVEIYSEYLDIEWFPVEAYAGAGAEFLRQKYDDRNIRVIVASAPQAVQFAIKFRDRIASRSAGRSHRHAARPVGAHVASARCRRQDHRSRSDGRRSSSRFACIPTPSASWSSSARPSGIASGSSGMRGAVARLGKASRGRVPRRACPRRRAAPARRR